MDWLPEYLKNNLQGGDSLLVIPPFFNSEFIGIGPYLLQALARQQGKRVDILQFDLLLARTLGVETYREIQNSAPYQMIGERLFAHYAYAMPPLGHTVAAMANQEQAITPGTRGLVYTKEPCGFTTQDYYALEAQCYALMQELEKAMDGLVQQYPVVGVSLSFANQINPSVAFLNLVEKVHPEGIRILGGSYLTEEKAPGLLSLLPTLHHLFVGESERSFLNFLRASDRSGFETLIPPAGTLPLEAMPLPDYEAYAQQVMAILGEDFFREQVRALWYESNRGCWWADKSKCTFCGIAEGGFRHKPMDRVLEDLRWLQGRFPDKYVFFTDLIINEGFAGKLLAALPDTEALPPLGMQLKVFRELHEVAELRAIQARVILPGIESFSTRLLKRMRKGTTGKQNLYFLRNAQSMGIQTQYALIWGFPGDTREEYDYLRWLIPKISHIRPPREFEAAQLLRDAPMYQEAGTLGITNLAYWKVYDMVYPEWADKASLANYFVGDFPSEIYQAPELLQELEALVVQWRNHHRQSCLHMQSIGNGQYLIEDRRMVHGYEMRHHLVQEPRAQHIMTPTRMAACTEDHAWALEQALGVVLDDWYVPLVLAQSDLLLMLDQSATEVPIQQETAFDTMNS